jgi:CHAT domain-containing protein/tetratricopeptide (TPR) repeat protein
MRSVTFTVVLLASILLLPSPTRFARAQGGLACPPSAKATDEERRALLSTAGKYLAALKAKDWDTAQEMAGTLLASFNHSQALMRDLLQPLEIERMSFEVGEAELQPCRASVSYRLSLKAVDPRTRKPAIDVTGLRRVTQWMRVACECPPNDITPWVLVRDQADVGEMAAALAAAKSPQEQRLLLLNKDESELKELAAAFARRGYESFEQGREAEALAAFGLNRVVVGEMRHQRTVWNQNNAAVLERALAEAEKRNDPGGRGSLLFSLAQEYAELGEYTRALKLFEESLRLLGPGGGDEAAGAYAGVAAINRNRGDYERAIEYFSKSAEIYRPLAARGDKDAKEGLLDALFNLAFLHEALGREDLAQKAYDALGRAAGKGSLEEALFLLLRGVVKTVKGNVAEAVGDMEAASGMLERVESEDKETFSFMASFLLVEPYLRRNDYPQAARHLARARDFLRLAKEDEVPEDIVLLLESMLYGVQGDERLAASRAGQIYGELIGQMLKGSGVVDTAASGRRDAKPPFVLLPNVLALQAANNLIGGVLGDAPASESFDLADVLKAAALAYLIRGDLPTARLWFSRALRLAEDDGDVVLAAQMHRQIGDTYRREKNYPQALNHYRKSLQSLEGARLPLTLHLTERDPNTTSAWLNIARVYAESGDPEQALAAYRKIFERGGRFYRLLDTTILYEMAELNFKLGRHGEALDIVERALTAATRGGDRDVLWKLHTLAGRARRALKQEEPAAHSFAEAIREVEASRVRVVGGGRIAARFFEDKLSPYHEMISMLVEQGRCAEAFAYAERSKSRVLLDVLRRGGAASRPLTAAEREKERALRVRMFAADREYTSAQEGAREGQLRVKRLEARLEYEAFRVGLLLPGTEDTSKPGAPAEVIEPAQFAPSPPPAGGALLEFVVTNDKTYLFVLTEGSPPTREARCEAHAIPVGAEKLLADVADFNKRIANPAGVVRPLARELYDLLLGPARAALAGRTSLVIVPDRGLWTLPFQALQASDGRYLLQESAVSYAPSQTALREMRKVQPTRAGLKLFAVANPAGSVPPLPTMEALAQRLARLYGPGLSKVYVGAQATEERVKKETRGYGLIHVSAHGILDDDDPMYSRVELAGAGGPDKPRPKGSGAESAEDGMLEAWEIMDLELDARLVVFSACQTARGRVGNGEGIVGLTWALFIAGVPASVVSQWAVDEEATSELMYLFHENLLKGRSTEPERLHKGESLRQAALKLLSSPRFAHPYYWAGFILVGDER